MKDLSAYGLQIPIGFLKTVERVHGDLGRQWLLSLPDLIDECCRRWSLELDPPFENLSYNLVRPGRMLGTTEIVLKLGVPCNELTTEAAALNLFQGMGTVRLLDQDTPRGILLLERVSPGTPIYNMEGDLEATRSAATLMRRLWRPLPEDHPFPSLAVWFRAFERLRKRFEGASGPFPPELIIRAERLFAELIGSSAGSAVLHGDLHHANILFSAERGWLAIDPKGICGGSGIRGRLFHAKSTTSRGIGVGANWCPCSKTLNFFARVEYWQGASRPMGILPRGSVVIVGV